MRLVRGLNEVVLLCPLISRERTVKRMVKLYNTKTYRPKCMSFWLEGALVSKAIDLRFRNRKSMKPPVNRDVKPHEGWHDKAENRINHFTRQRNPRPNSWPKSRAWPPPRPPDLGGILTNISQIDAPSRRALAHLRGRWLQDRDTKCCGACKLWIKRHWDILTAPPKLSQIVIIARQEMP